MRSQIPHVLLGVLGALLFLPSLIFAQGDSCPAIVYYGAPNDVPGQDVGQCTAEENACQTLDYALAQGLNLCPTAVNVFFVDAFNLSKQIEWRPPPASSDIKDTLWLVTRWIGPAVGLAVGWLAAWVWTRRRQGGEV